MTPAGRRVVLVAAVAANGVIGDGPRIPWKVPGEQARFRERTLGHVLVMGRATYESIGRPLPGRTTVVLTRDPDWRAAGPGGDGVLVASSLDDALEVADGVLAARSADPSGEPGHVVIAGGGAVYAAALAVDGPADEQVLTEIPLSPDGDTRYPAFSREEWREVERVAFDGFTEVRWVRA